MPIKFGRSKIFKSHKSDPGAGKGTAFFPGFRTEVIAPEPNRSEWGEKSLPCDSPAIPGLRSEIEKLPGSVDIHPGLLRMMQRMEGYRQDLSNPQRELVWKMRVAVLAAVTKENLTYLMEDESYPEKKRIFASSTLSLTASFFRLRDHTRARWRFERMGPDLIRVTELICTNALLTIGWSEEAIESKLFTKEANAVYRVMLPTTREMAGLASNGMLPEPSSVNAPKALVEGWRRK